MKPKGRNDGHRFDHSRVSEYIYLGSDFCTGRECREHSLEFEKLGVCVEINLAAEKKEIPPDNIDIYSWIPVVDGYAPTIDQMMLGTSIINEAVTNNNTVYIHCKNGHGRSPTLVAAYLIRYKGKSVSEALDFLESKRPEIHIEKSQSDALDEFAKLWSK